MLKMAIIVKNDAWSAGTTPLSKANAISATPDSPAWARLIPTSKESLLLNPNAFTKNDTANVLITVNPIVKAMMRG